MGFKPETLPAYPRDIGADVLVLAVEAQHQTEIREDAEGDEGSAGVRVVGQVPQGCRQLRGVKGQDEGDQKSAQPGAFLVEAV